MSNNVQEVRDRIIKLAREIEEFSKSNIPPETFFTEFLKRVVGAVGARAGVVWLRNESNRLEMVAEVGLSNTTFNENPASLQVNHAILVDVMSNGQACMHHPGETDVELPTQDMLVLAALQREKEVVGVVEIFQRNDTPAQARPGFLQFVEQMSGYACRYLNKQAAPQEQVGMTIGSVAAEFETFILQLHNTLDPREVAFTAANDGRLLIKADRVSVAILDGKKAVIRAVSGQEKVNQRANLVRRMTKLASRVIKTKERLLYTGKVENLAPKVETALADFIQESGSRMVLVIPIFQPDPLVEKEDQVSRPKEKIRVPVGGLIIEQIAESQPKSGVVETSELIADHVGSAVYNAKTYNRLFLMPVWRGLGKVFGFLEGRNGVKALLILGLLVATIVAMILIPYEYRVSGEGRLMPVDVADVFAPWDGEVIDIVAVSGKPVKKGDVLLTIKSDEMRKEMQDTKGNYDVARVSLIALENESAKTEDRFKRVEIDGKIRQKREEIKSLETQLAILKQREQSLEVKAPRDGVVATFQLKQTLLNRPVRRGERLLEIKDDKGKWQLELEVEEHRMGHLLGAQLKQKLIELPVEFHLATDAVTMYKGHIKDVQTRTNSSQESGSIVVIHCSFDKTQLQSDVELRIGADVRAKIDCGERSLGYVLFGDVVEFFQKYFWL